MKHFTLTILGFLSLVFFSMLFSCKMPHPLYGVWADNRGNTISFFEDNTFIARVNSGIGIKTYEGNYSLLLNSMTLNCTNVDFRVVSEWDIRGNLLYLDWPLDDGNTSSLTLYKVSN